MTNIQTAGQHIFTTAIETLAAKHNVTFDTVVNAIKGGNEHMKAQFAQLVAEGVKAAKQLAAEGRINL